MASGGCGVASELMFSACSHDGLGCRGSTTGAYQNRLIRSCEQRNSIDPQGLQSPLTSPLISHHASPLTFPPRPPCLLLINQTLSVHLVTALGGTYSSFFFIGSGQLEVSIPGSLGDLVRVPIPIPIAHACPGTSWIRAGHEYARN
jgi:hypothetical protein